MRPWCRGGRRGRRHGGGDRLLHGRRSGARPGCEGRRQGQDPGHGADAQRDRRQGATHPAPPGALPVYAVAWARHALGSTTHSELITARRRQPCGYGRQNVSSAAGIRGEAVSAREPGYASAVSCQHSTLDGPAPATSTPSKSARVLMRNCVGLGRGRLHRLAGAPRSSRPGRSPRRPARSSPPARAAGRRCGWPRCSAAPGRRGRTASPGASSAGAHDRAAARPRGHHAPAIGGQEPVDPMGEPHAPRRRRALVHGDEDRHHPRHSGIGGQVLVGAETRAAGLLVIDLVLEVDHVLARAPPQPRPPAARATICANPSWHADTFSVRHTTSPVDVRSAYWPQRWLPGRPRLTSVVQARKAARSSPWRAPRHRGRTVTGALRRRPPRHRPSTGTQSSSAGHAPARRPWRRRRPGAARRRPRTPATTRTRPARRRP